MIKNTFSGLAVLLLIVLLYGCGKEQTAENLPKPNILWIVSEDNSPILGVYGDTFATTPNFDKLTARGVFYQNAFAAAPVCAPNRNTLITGMYANSLGTENMRSTYPIPDFVHFYPYYLKQAGYYVTNNQKKDYNTIDQPEVWDESSDKATWRNRKPGQPFFHIQNYTVSHESSIHSPVDSLRHDPEAVRIPPYHPRTEEMKHDWAQYYDKVEDLDRMAGELLQQLEEDGLTDSTIVFYYSDHGGVLGRSKRFIYESGLRIPLIVAFPEMYRHLAPAEPGSSLDRIVSFVDLSPTLLSLAGVQVPEFMQGQPFLGEQQTAPREYAYSFRGRMDERMDLVRSVRDKEYRYVNNYMPHRIYGQYIEYLWRAPSMRSWENAYLKGELNEVQSRFFQPKPAEELYDVKADPDNVKNLAEDPQYQEVMQRMRQANNAWIMDIKDVGFIPEAMALDISENMPLYTYAREQEYPLERIVETASLASSRDQSQAEEILNRLNDPNPIVRYWAAVGCIVLKPASAIENLKNLLNDPEVSVQIVAAEALYTMGEVAPATKALISALENGNLMARVQALNVLENMGDDARPALEAVKKLMPADKDRDYDTRAAERLLQKFGVNI